MVKFFLLVALLIPGCATTHAPRWVTRSFSPKGGIVAYRTDVWQRDQLKEGREMALNEISAYCDGKYTLLSESASSEYRGSMYSNDSSTPIYNKYMNMAFKCEEHAPANAEDTLPQFTKYMTAELPKTFCSEKKYFRSCFKVSGDECVQEVERDTKVCIDSMKDEMPIHSQQPPVKEWSSKLGGCVSHFYEVVFQKNKIDSEDCKNHSI